MQTKNEIKVCFAEQKLASALEASSILDHQEKHAIDCLSWPSYPYKPSVFFSIAHTSDAVLLKFYVAEKFVIASVSNINGDVYKDSCVEVFLAFDEGQYYNLEFNCLGIARAEYGKERANRIFLPAETVKQIRYQTFSYNKQEEIVWELTLVIPFSVFIYNQLGTLKGKRIKANFYKCGDDLPEPHFLSWSPIQSAQPDFHLPSFFGNIYFNKSID